MPRNSERIWWEASLRKDGQEWILSHAIWQKIWAPDTSVIPTISFNPEVNCAHFIGDPQNRGFFIIKKQLSAPFCEIYFAYTASEFRGQGIARNLLKIVESQFRDHTILLECEGKNRGFWEHMGFELQMKEDSHLCDGWYVYGKRTQPRRFVFRPK